MFEITSFFLAFAVSGPAQAKVEVKREQNQIRMSSDSCAEVRESLVALNKWTLSTGGKGQCATNVSGSGACSADITSCVPEHVAKYQGVSPEMGGPNCWNLALVMKGILPNLRNTTSDEMAFYMKPPLCRPLKNSEVRQPGDVGAIRSKGNAETHGFIYVSKTLAYSKNGDTKTEPYALQPLSEVLEGYGVSDDPRCRKNQINERAGCAEAVATFRCQSLKSYMDKNPDIPKEIRAAFDQVGQYEQCLEKSVLSGASLGAKSRTNLIDSAKALFAYMEKAEGKAQLASMQDERKKFLFGSLRLRLESIAKQLLWIGDLEEKRSNYTAIIAISERMEKALGEKALGEKAEP